MKPKEQTKAINDKSDDNDNSSISKEIYDKLLEERMDEILKMSKEINYINSVYDFKSSTPSMSLTKLGGLMYTYYQLKTGKKHYNK